jgi:hypothetical protein
MSERDYWDEESLQEYRAYLISQRNQLDPITNKLHISVLDDLLKNLPDKYPVSFEQEENQLKELPKEVKSNGLMSKRIAVVVSLLLCVTLYLLFLTTAFTTKRDTYICYTTKTGEYFHSAVCSEINKNAYETTVYEACHDYKPCWQCNPYAKNYKTTITVRNYIYPILISVPISILVFLLLGYRKEK